MQSHGHNCTAWAKVAGGAVSLCGAVSMECLTGSRTYKSHIMSLALGDFHILQSQLPLRQSSASPQTMSSVPQARQLYQASDSNYLLIGNEAIERERKNLPLSHVPKRGVRQTGGFLFPSAQAVEPCLLLILTSNRVNFHDAYHQGVQASCCPASRPTPSMCDQQTKALASKDCSPQRGQCV